VSFELESASQSHNIPWIYPLFQLPQPTQILPINFLQRRIKYRIVRIFCSISNVLSLPQRNVPDLVSTLSDRAVKESVFGRVVPQEQHLERRVAERAVGWVGARGGRRAVREYVGEEGFYGIADEKARVGRE